MEHILYEPHGSEEFISRHVDLRLRDTIAILLISQSLVVSFSDIPLALRNF